jgi:hypothetical protein
MAPTKSATARYRLPNTVVPRTYRLTIEPDSDKLIYNGVVEIDTLTGEHGRRPTLLARMQTSRASLSRSMPMRALRPAAS